MILIILLKNKNNWNVLKRLQNELMQLMVIILINHLQIIK